MTTITTNLALVIFWTSAMAVVFTYAVYPVLLAVATRLFGRRPEPPSTADAHGHLRVSVQVNEPPLARAHAAGPTHHLAGR